MTSIKITHQTFRDLTTWLISPEEHSKEQLVRLSHEDLYLPLMSLANRYWLIGTLTHSLQGSTVWHILPDELKEYLIDISKIYSDRNEIIKNEAIDVCTLLSNAQVEVILMKGVASLFNGSIDPICKRYMNDIDLLVPEDQQQYAYELLEQAGYAKDNDYFSYRNSHHAPPLLRNNVCYIELHRWLLEKHLQKVIDTKKVWKNAMPVVLNNELRLKQLNPSQQVILSIAHSEIQNGGYDQYHIDLHQLFNLHSIINHYRLDIDWSLVYSHFKKSGQEVVLQAILYSAYELAGINTPITDINDPNAKVHFNKCISSFVKSQGRDSAYSVLMEQLKFYNKRNIKLLYGDDTYFWYVKGVCMQVVNHMRKIFHKHHLQLFLDRFRPS